MSPLTRDGFLGLALLIATMGLLLFPLEAIAAAQEGLTLCYHVIIPSLFPFFVLSTLVVELGLARYLGKALQPVMRPLFRVNGNCGTALALGFVGGYPVGAKTAIHLYRQGLCTKGEAQRLLGFCNNSGPAFILGVVGAGIFSSSKIGLLLYVTHALASVVVGILFRWYPDCGDEGGCGTPEMATFQAKRATAAFVEAVRQSFFATLNICAFVVFFTVVIQLFVVSGLLPMVAQCLAFLLAPFGVTAMTATRLFTGLVEISSGVWSLTGEGGLHGKLSLAAFMLGWAGISVHCQVLTFLGESGLSAKSYIIGKLLHGVISAILVFLLVQVVPLESSVSTVLASQVEDMSQWEFHVTLVSASLWALLAFGLCALMTAISMRKRTRKRKKTMVLWK